MILSFGILYQNDFCYGPFSSTINSTIGQTFDEIVNNYKISDNIDNDIYDEIFSTKKLIINKLEKHSYYVLNGYSKYYSIVFGIDYKKFAIFTRDNCAEIINWNTDDNELYKNNLSNNDKDHIIDTLLNQLTNEKTYCYYE